MYRWWRQTFRFVDPVKGSRGDKPSGLSDPVLCRPSPCTLPFVKLRRTRRHPEFDYRGPHAYFVTICTFRRRPLFKDVTFARDAISKLLQAAVVHGFALPAYCLMPDHVHLAAEGLRDDSRLTTLIHSWNTQTGYAWRQTFRFVEPDRHVQVPLWQPGYFDHVMREGESILGVARYIVMNPVRAGLVVDPQDYEFTGSTLYTIEEILEAADDWRPMW
jgi:putative transposase